jgi:ABC-type Mn2+/Zn2+ transport system ATPase subunit
MPSPVDRLIFSFTLHHTLQLHQFFGNITVERSKRMVNSVILLSASLIVVILALAASSAAFEVVVSYSSSKLQKKKFDTQLTSTATPITTAASSTGGLGVTVGDTKGAVLYLNDINISTGSGIQILKSINFRVDAKERWGVVGPNGCGKSTLLGAITGTVRIDDGEALVASKVKVGYLKQTAVSGSKKTVRDEASSEMEEINAAKEWMNQLEQQIAQGDNSDKILNDLSTAQERFANAGGWTQDQDVDVVLKGLGFQPSDSERLCSDFSGGWQMRIALARLLLSARPFTAR